MDIYVIVNGRVDPFLQEAYLDAQLPVLPPEVVFVELTWAGPDDLVRK